MKSEPNCAERVEMARKRDGQTDARPIQSEERVLVLSKHVPWYGGHSGYYEMLPGALEDAGASVKLVTPRPGLGARFLGKLWAIWNGLPARDQTSSEAEWRFLRQFERDEAHGLILAIEDNLPLLASRRFRRGNRGCLTGAIHYPRHYWNDAMLEQLRRLPSALILYRADISFFEQHIGKGKVLFVPHGVNTVFFQPGRGAIEAKPRLLASGQFGRDFRLLLEMFRLVSSRVPGIGLDIVGAHHAVGLSEMRTLTSLPNVKVHSWVTDETLLALYQTAAALVLPLEECGANNSLVEALACGLPIVATDVGGVRDYGGGNLFPIVARGDAGAMAAEVESLVHNAERRATIAQRSRAYAERELSWPIVARAHLQALRQLR